MLETSLEARSSTFVNNVSVQQAAKVKERAADLDT